MADRRSWSRARAAAALLLSLGRSGAAQAPPTADVSPVTVPANGRQVATLHVPRFGRYAIAAASAQGAALALVDRTAGELQRAGSPGREDGRLDLLLDRGEYRLIVESDRHGGGQVKLAAVPSTERNPEPAPRLVEEKLVAATLGDHEQRSYWLEIGERRPVFLEAAGRHLDDLRLWRDGRWLEDATPRCSTTQPVAGQPRRDCTLTATVDPGLVQVVAYGGRGLAWSVGDDQPLDLRWGIPRLGAAGRGRFTAGPFGVDRFLLPTSVNFVRLELAPSRTATLRVGAWRAPEAPFVAPTAVRAVTKESRPPVAEIRLTDDTDLTQAPQLEEEAPAEDVTASGEEGEPEETATADDAEDTTTADQDSAEASEAETPPSTAAEPAAWRWLEVTLPPGESYVLQQFELRDAYPFRRSGTYWLATVSAGPAADDLDASAVLSTPNIVQGRQRDELVAAAAVRLGRGRPWARRFNLLASQELIVEVLEAGRYAVTASGAAALFTLQPYVTSPAATAATPKPRASGEAWNLEPGLYRLTIEPRAKGVAEVALHEAVAGAPPPGAPRASARLGPVELDGAKGYLLRPAARPVPTGLVLRPWPLDLSVALPLELLPGEEITLATDVREPGTLRALDEQGQVVPIAVDGAAATPAPLLGPGAHRVALRGEGATSRLLTLALEPLRLAAATPLEPLPASTAFPRFAELRPGQPAFLDLEASGRATYLVQADQPGAYRLQSTGLLATEGVLRTRTVIAVERGSANGSGRNFLLQPYLGAGDYQVTVAAQGKTHGHLGLELTRTPVVDGGALALGRVGRATLAAGQALLYRFRVEEPGTYRVRALAPAATFAVRVEDAEGWPLLKPATDGDLERELEAGEYRLMLLPRAVSGPALALVERVEKGRRGKGHGPEPLPLGRRVEHLWEEPAAGAPRAADAWTFELPAPVHATIALDSEMQGHLSGPGGGPPQLVPPGRGFAGELAAGSYRLEVECSRRNNLVPYSLLLETRELVAGTARQVTAPAEIAVAVGRDGLVEIDSLAPAAVRAELLDGERRVVARSEERPDDWNFLLAPRLRAGAYTLRVEALGARAVEAMVAMRAPAEEALPAAPLPLARELPASDGVRLVPLDLGRLPRDASSAPLIVAEAAAQENVSLGVELGEAGGWTTLAQATGRTPRVLVVPRAGDTLRLRIASLDHRGLPVTVRASVPPLRRVSEAALARGVELAPGGGLTAALALLDRPGVFAPARLPAGLRWTGAPGSALSLADREPIAASGQRLWLVATAAGTAQIHRQTAPADGPVLRLRIAPQQSAVVDLPVGNGPVVVRASASSGQPGVLAGGSASLAASRGAAVAVAAGGVVQAEVWNPRAGDAIDVDVTARRFGPAVAAMLTDGRAEGIVAAGRAVALALPGGPLALQLRLGRASVGALVDAKGVRRTLWGGGEAFAGTLVASASTLWVLNPGADDEPFAVEALPAPASASVRPAAPLARHYGAAGIEWITVDPGTAGPTELHVRGAVQRATFVGEAGAPACLAEGPDLSPCGAGTLAIEHGIGTAVAWLDRPGAELEAWKPAGGWAPLRAAPPAALDLAGDGTRLEVAVADGQVLRVRIGGPALALVARRGRPALHLLDSGGQLDLLPDGGRVELYLRGVFGQPLAGRLELVAAPVATLGEGLAAPVLLGPGERRYFRVDVAAAGRVGFGVQSASPAVEAELSDAGGEPLGHGVVQMHDLATGTYLLALSLPAPATAAAVRPAVVGLTRRDTGPPEDVIRSYLQQASETPQ